ncbi:uncharacterized protein N7483_010670 [Penicillium malachiteum]|uniref:uncharacterized protein n=1 Tax=Penicillium malachiteum TaxID=1324776 RepID=UPI002546E7B6|nr:uncharacterized protein N7483_010670 [Penicillium malachiteum]KAJ5713489.1 hypothetical protein N7483_010670 [Penicillium malachiteum]
MENSLYQDVRAAAASQEQDHIENSSGYDAYVADFAKFGAENPNPIDDLEMRTYTMSAPCSSR